MISEELYNKWLLEVASQEYKGDLNSLLLEVDLT